MDDVEFAVLVDVVEMVDQPDAVPEAVQLSVPSLVRLEPLDLVLDERREGGNRLPRVAGRSSLRGLREYREGGASVDGVRDNAIQMSDMQLTNRRDGQGLRAG